MKVQSILLLLLLLFSPFTIIILTDYCYYAVELARQTGIYSVLGSSVIPSPCASFGFLIVSPLRQAYDSVGVSVLACLCGLMKWHEGKIIVVYFSFIEIAY